MMEWQEFFAEQPFGDERADLRAGIIAAVIANVNRDPDRKKLPFTPLDFMPYAKQEQRQTAEQQKEIVSLIKQAMD